MGAGKIKAIVDREGLAQSKVIVIKYVQEESAVMWIVLNR